MKCYKCNEKIENGYTNYISKLGDKVIIIENTPTCICPICFENFYKEIVVDKIENYIDSLENIRFKLITIDYNEI